MLKCLTRPTRSIMDRYAKLTGVVSIAKPTLHLPNRPLPGQDSKQSSPKSPETLIFPPNRSHFTRSEVPQSAKLPLIPSTSSDRSSPEISAQKSLRVSLVGLPNAGKSSLANALVQAPVAAVSPKSHTTRELVQGIRTIGNFQLLVDDLPGLVAVKKSEEVRKFVASAWTASETSDLKILVVDVCKRVDPELVKILRSIGNFSKVILVLNKVDSLAPNSPTLHLRRQELEALSPDGSRFDKVFFVSAKDGNGVNRLLGYLQSRALDRPWLFPQSAVARGSTSLSKVEQIEQQTRNFLYVWFNGDLPYKLRPEVVAWDERLDGSIAFEQELRVKDTVVARMVLGVRNRLVKNLEEKVSERLSKLWGVSVKMRVVVRAEKVRESRKDRAEKAERGIENCGYRL